MRRAHSCSSNMEGIYRGPDGLAQECTAELQNVISFSEIKNNAEIKKSHAFEASWLKQFFCCASHSKTENTRYCLGEHFYHIQIQFWDCRKYMSYLLRAIMNQFWLVEIPFLDDTVGLEEISSKNALNTDLKPRTASSHELALWH